MKVNVYGGVAGDTGYDSHTRGLVKGLSDIGVDVYVECALPQFWDRIPHLQPLIPILKKGPARREVTVMVAQPSFWAYKLSDRPKKFYGYVVWEGDVIPSQWVDCCNDSRVDGVIVPSEHTLNACLKAGVRKDKLFVVSHGVDTDLFCPKIPDKKGVGVLFDDKVCTFLFNKGWSNGKDDRSGFDILAEAFTEEFDVSEPVRLLVHINSAYNGPLWNFGVEYNKLGLTKQWNKVVHVQNNLSFDKLPDLYRCADFVVSASKAESFNLSILEGMSCGCVPIVPDTGAEIEFASKGFVYGHDEVIPATGGGYSEEVCWRLPSKVGLRRVLRDAFELWKKGGCVREARHCGLTWKKCAESLLGVLK